MLLILKFKCPWCGEKKEVQKQIDLKRDSSVIEIDLDRYRTCTRCKLERRDDVVS